MTQLTSFVLIATLCIEFSYIASIPIAIPFDEENYGQQVGRKNNVDISMNENGRPIVTGSSSNMLWQSSDNSTAVYFHTNASGGGWEGVLELKRPGGGGTLGIKRPPEGGRPVVSVAGSTTVYESNGTSVGVNGMVDSSGHREGHMSIQRP